ncbi:MAG TPA: SRPBCC domain-containing protein [Saprospiraceae bacterium]|nr:SRPBCC domain-containing protein [Saprospiraceae bacterium]
MNNTNFTTAILVDKTHYEAFNAITNISGWWSESIEGGTTELNDEFIYHYKDIHYCKMKLVELVPDQRLVWLVLDNYFNFIKDNSEWVGTKVVFDIAQNGDQTEIKFTHEGLVPQYECFEICREAWTNYIQESLFNLITKGKGAPNPIEDDGFNEELVVKWKLRG